MKIGLLTFARTNNYGATLQCYALSRYLIERGHHVEIINTPLINAGGNRNLALNERVINRIKKLFKFKINEDYSQRYDRNEEEKLQDKYYDKQNMLLFDEFRNNYLPNFTREYINEEDFNEEYPQFDLYIVGSDQVWNLWVTNIQFKLFFFSFLKNNEKRISYAPSFGGDSNFKFKKNEITTIKLLLDKFNGISVRDETGVNILNKRFNIDVEQVLDPTFLIDNYDYLLTDSNLNGRGCLYNFKFIINDKWVEVIKFISNKLNLEIRMESCSIKVNGLPFKPLCSIQDWLKLIKTSDFVFTDSFHGMVFCILFKKQFIVTPSYNGGEERYFDLAKKLGIEDRIYTNPNDIIKNYDNWVNLIDYDTVYFKLNELKKESKTFLLNNLC